MKTANKFKLLMFVMIVSLLVVWGDAGNLNPPNGPITGTMKDLNTVEPRTPISTLPFTIGAPGSYYVTRDLTGSSGILIACSDVALDLCGFALRGVPGSGDGISIINAQSRISISNGKVSSWDGIGINTQSSHKVTLMMMQTENNGKGTDGDGDTHVLYMQADGNRDFGIRVGNNCIIVDSTVIGTTNGPGISAGTGCKIEDCISAGNSGDGFSVGEGSLVAHCTMSANGGNGLTASSGSGSKGCNITDSIAVSNTGTGISAAAGSTVTACTGQSNGIDGISAAAGCTVSNCTARGNTGDGIEAAGDCLVARNNSSANGPTNNGAGIRILPGGGTRVEENNCSSNGHNFEITAAGNLIVKNSSTGGGMGGIAGTGFYIVPGNAVGQIVNEAGALNFVASAWANLQY